MQRLSTLLFVMILISSCYRMPSDDDYCVIPTTNNPDVTREGPGQLVPGMKM